MKDDVEPVVWAGHDPFTGQQVLDLLKENESLRQENRRLRGPQITSIESAKQMLQLALDGLEKNAIKRAQAESELDRLKRQIRSERR